MPDDPHDDQPIERAGVPVDDADQAVILLHGRGATAQSILELAEQFDTADAAFLAPQAASRTWYPESFLAPIDDNEPWLSSALQCVGTLLEEVQNAGIGEGDAFLIGFSQGACLATEYAARNANRYGGVVGLSGGLIGDKLDRSRYTGDMDGTPVFLGCSDRDPHIPVDRVHDTADVFEALDADVEKRIYEGMGHTIIDDELAFVRQLL